MANTTSSKSNSDRIKEWQTKLIDVSYKSDSTNSSSGEIIDILSDYTWIADEIIEKAENSDLNTYSKKNNLPFCYIIERKSAANAGIANIINMLSNITEMSDKSLDAINNTAKTLAGDTFIETLAEKGTGAIKSISDKVKGTLGSIINSTKFNELLSANNLNDSDLLSPYRYLYITKETKKRYVMPLVSDSSNDIAISNKWGTPQMLPGYLQNFADIGFELLDTASGVANLFNNFNNIINGSGDDTGNNRELAKSYQYPQDGDTVKVSFTLYNTTKLDAWKQNYKFIFLFALRNLPVRIDVSSFLPPLLYDIIVPGSKRLPVCSVDSLHIKSLGMVRTLETSNFLEPSEGNIIVNVPEAWQVDITFRSLIGHSANLMLSAVIGSKLKVKSKTTAESIKNDTESITSSENKTEAAPSSTL